MYNSLYILRINRVAHTFSASTHDPHVARWHFPTVVIFNPIEDALMQKEKR